MQINVTGRHLDITDAIRDHIHNKLTHAFHDFPRVLHVHVILDVQKHRQLAELVVQAANHVDVEATAESDDLYVSIDGAIDRAAKQLRRRRDRVQDHKPRAKLGALEAETVEREAGAE